MILNVNTNIGEEIKKCCELLAKYEQLEEQTKQLRFITIKELAEILRLFTKYSENNF